MLEDAAAAAAAALVFRPFGLLWPYCPLSAAGLVNLPHVPTPLDGSRAPSPSVGSQ